MNRRFAIYTMMFGVAFTAVIAEDQKANTDKTDKIDKNLISGVWLAHPFDGPGTKPRIELKENKKARLLMQDDEEKEAIWEWKEPATILITYTETGRTVEAKVSLLGKDSMTMVSTRGRETKYVKLASWDAKEPKKSEQVVPPNGP